MKINKALLGILGILTSLTGEPLASEFQPKTPSLSLQDPKQKEKFEANRIIPSLQNPAARSKLSACFKLTDADNASIEEYSKKITCRNSLSNVLLSKTLMLARKNLLLTQGIKKKFLANDKINLLLTKKAKGRLVKLQEARKAYKQTEALQAEFDLMSIKVSDVVTRKLPPLLQKVAKVAALKKYADSIQSKTPGLLYVDMEIKPKKESALAELLQKESRRISPESSPEIKHEYKQGE